MEQAHGEYKIAIEIADEKLKSPKVDKIVFEFIHFIGES